MTEMCVLFYLCLVVATILLYLRKADDERNH
jgi:hypothetical protein